MNRHARGLTGSGDHGGLCGGGQTAGLAGALLAILFTFFCQGALASVPDGGEAAGLSKKEMDKCYGCHDEKEDQHAKGPHANANCATCHTVAAEHLKTAKSKNIGTAPGRPAAAACQTCHKNDARRMNWKFAEHHKAGVECRDCHGVHTAKVNKRLDLSLWRADKNSQVCANCHQEVLARFNMRSHHPLKEGALSCMSCHDSHGAKQANLAARTAQCTQCHQAARGPHVFEHAPAVEDCGNCHNPHGSPIRKMLTASEPALCLQCHSLASRRHGQTGASSNNQLISGAVLRQCSTCHSQVHGSSQEQHLRF
ncbi:MAG: cytochrome c3 family protein [Gallionellaceae bacterium]|nr:cytochrome c3 family protein [Gallionellaceae bacterium]